MRIGQLMRYTSSYFTFVGGNLVIWRSKKHKVVSRSSAEAEYGGMAPRICEIMRLCKLLWGLGFKQKETVKLDCDNKSARDIVDNLVQHDRTKHVVGILLKRNLRRRLYQYHL